ncbi:MAG: hypothetical protein ACLTYN_11260 [Dysosmobacter welbionis]
MSGRVRRSGGRSRRRVRRRRAGNTVTHNRENIQRAEASWRGDRSGGLAGRRRAGSPGGEIDRRIGELNSALAALLRPPRPAEQAGGAGARRSACGHGGPRHGRRRLTRGGTAPPPREEAIQAAGGRKRTGPPRSKSHRPAEARENRRPGDARTRRSTITSSPATACGWRNGRRRPLPPRALGSADHGHGALENRRLLTEMEKNYEASQGGQVRVPHRAACRASMAQWPIW